MVSEVEVSACFLIQLEQGLLRGSYKNSAKIKHFRGKLLYYNEFSSFSN